MYADWNMIVEGSNAFGELLSILPSDLSAGLKFSAAMCEALMMCTFHWRSIVFDALAFNLKYYIFEFYPKFKN